MSETVKQALKMIPEKELQNFFEEHFQKPLLMNLDAGILAPDEFKNQRKQTINIKNYLLTYREK